MLLARYMNPWLNETISPHLILILMTILVESSLNLKSFVRGELFTSVSDLAKITVTHDSIASILDDHIRLEEKRLDRLRRLKQSYITDLNNIKSKTDDAYSDRNTSLHSPRSNRLDHPINAFISVKRLTKGIEHIYQVLVEDANENSQTTQAKIDQFKKNNHLPNEDDYHGVSDAILRLQQFYRLDIHNLAEGRLIGKSIGILGLSKNQEYTEDTGAKLTYEDCYSLGVIAYNRESYSSAMGWFEEALNLYRSARMNKHASSPAQLNSTNPSFCSNLKQVDIDNELQVLTEIDILEYLAFSAFKRGQIKYAYQTTLQWVNLDPDDTKAKGNIDYYLSILHGRRKYDNSLVSEDDIGQTMIGDDGSKAVPEDKVSSQTLFGQTSRLNLSTEEEVTEALCRGESIYLKLLLVQKLRCYMTPIHKQLELTKMLNFKTEILFTSPEIIRIYNFLTDEESNYLQQISQSKLERSTIHTSDGQHPSKYRIAKTAWLDMKNPIVKRIEQRIADVLYLRLEETENLQVVNYGLGGYYAPHFDFRSDIHEEKRDSSKDMFKKDNRLATFLIYLSHVEAGGSTVFPQLGVTVEPIQNSAVFWFNIHKNGLGDYRTKHSGCPVLYGSKWIATRWFRENANAFTRPCSLNPSD